MGELQALRCLADRSLTAFESFICRPGIAQRAAALRPALGRGWKKDVNRIDPDNATAPTKPCLNNSESCASDASVPLEVHPGSIERGLRWTGKSQHSIEADALGTTRQVPGSELSGTG